MSVLWFGLIVVTPVQLRIIDFVHEFSGGSKIARGRQPGGGEVSVTYYYQQQTKLQKEMVLHGGRGGGGDIAACTWARGCGQGWGCVDRRVWTRVYIPCTPCPPRRPLKWAVRVLLDCVHVWPNFCRKQHGNEKLDSCPPPPGQQDLPLGDIIFVDMCCMLYRLVAF